MAKGIIGIIKEKIQAKKLAALKAQIQNDTSTDALDENQKAQEQKKKEIAEYLNIVNKQTDNLFQLAEPKVFSLAKESNIAFKYSDNFVVTKDGNIVMGVELDGASYAGLTLDEEVTYLQSRIGFFNRLTDNIEINLIIKKAKVVDELAGDEQKMMVNPFANEIIQKWESNQQVFKIQYFLLISTINKNITGALESFRTKTTSDTTADNSESFKFNNKLSNLKELYQEIRGDLSVFKPHIMSGDDIINFYATYSNAQETKLKYTHELITDCFISSYIEFKKDHMEFYRNDGKTIYSRFLSIKAYETEAIQSLMTTNLVRNKNEYMVMIHIHPFQKEKAIKKIKDTGAFAAEIVRAELSELMEQVKADRENLVQVSYSVLLSDESYEALENKTNEIKSILQNQGLNIVRETINQKALYFSFFPSRGNLNARKKTLKISNLSTIATFENEDSGFNRNDWGNGAVTTFQHINGTPFLFNFHWQERGDRPSGHTMIIGGTGAGKTTLAQFLMCNCFKYPIDIFSMDKLRGMHNFALYTDGEYHDSERDQAFKLNPFLLDPTPENLEFLNSWLCFMANIKAEDADARNQIKGTLERFYQPLNWSDGKVMKLSNFIDSLPADKETNLKMKFGEYKDTIYDSYEDALQFKKQLSILNMDGILNNKKTAALTAMYIFHKLKNKAKNNTDKRGFLCFIDELKDYLNDETMREKILEAILEVRKIGGVMCMGFQSMSLFENMERGSSFLDNIANYIIFPTNSQQTIDELTNAINLTASEAKFLLEAGTNSRKVLLKMRLRNKSAILNIDLSRLNNHLKVFSSGSDNVQLMKKLMKENPSGWRQEYLNTELI